MVSKMPPARHGFKYCQWQEADMQMALTDVRKGISIKAAARKYNVPRSTLGDRVREKVKPGAKRGAPTKFPSKYEEDLVDYVTSKAKGASPLTVNQILTYAGSFDKFLNLNNFGDKGPSMHWWRGFKKRHPEVAIRRPDHPSTSRASNSTVKNLRKYFHLLKQTLEENDIVHEPKRIWNCDESIVDLHKSSQKVVVPRRHKDSIIQLAGTHHISIHNCVSANGGVMPPFVIFSKEFPDGNFAKDGPYGALYGRSDSGLMDEHLFFKWFDQVFLKECPHDRKTKPVLLLVDGHTSYCSPDLISKSKEENVILFSHTIHISQPLDVAVNESLKYHIEEFIDSGQGLSGDLWTTKKDAPHMIKTPFEKSMSLYNIREGFRKCGIYPFDPNGVDKTLLPKGVLADKDTDLSLLLSSPLEVDAGTQTDGSQNELEAPTATTVDHVNNAVVEDPLVDFVIVSTEKEAIFNASHENIISGRQQPLRAQSEAQVTTFDDEVVADLHKERKRKKAKKRKLEAEKRKRKEKREQRKKQKH